MEIFQDIVHRLYAIIIIILLFPLLIFFRQPDEYLSKLVIVKNYAHPEKKWYFQKWVKILFLLYQLYMKMSN